jgi:ribose 5-phosphate isomerase B
MSKQKVFIGADHGGFELKEDLKSHLGRLGYDVGDFGTHSAEPVDYPDIAFLVAQAVSGNHAAGGNASGIILDTIGQASAIVANKVPGIRAVMGCDLFAIKSSREHNDANVLCLGGQFLGAGLARSLVETWLETPYEGGRHQRRLDKIKEIEKRIIKG